MDTLPSKDAEKRATLRYLQDLYPQLAVKALHAERGTNKHREAQALADGLAAVILFLDPDGSISREYHQ